jgi:hypothetical protein
MLRVSGGGEGTPISMQESRPEHSLTNSMAIVRLCSDCCTAAMPAVSALSAPTRLELKLLAAAQAPCAA